MACAPALATMGGMTRPTPAPARGPLVMLGALAVLLVAAGALPWLNGGSGAAKGFATPLLLVGLFAGYAVLRAARAEQAPTTPPRPAGCGGCACGGGGCQGAG